MKQAHRVVVTSARRAISNAHTYAGVWSLCMTAFAVARTTFGSPPKLLNHPAMSARIEANQSLFDQSRCA